MKYIPHQPELLQRMKRTPNNLKYIALTMMKTHCCVVVKVNEIHWVILKWQGDRFALVLLNPFGTQKISGGEYKWTRSEATHLLTDFIWDYGRGTYEIVKNV